MQVKESQLTQFWGKCDRETKQTFPAVWHMMDVALVADELLNSLSEQEQQIILAPFYPSSHPEQVFLFFIALHDIGKLSPQFQYLVPEIIEFDQAIYVPVDKESSVKHGTIGQSLLSVVLEDKLKLDYEPASVLASFTVSHHGKFEWDGDSPLNRKLLAELGKAPQSEWRKLQYSAIEWLRQQCEVEWKDIRIDEDALTPQWYALSAGLCCIADWLGSDNSPEFFPYVQAASYAEIKDERLASAKRAVASRSIKQRLSNDSKLHAFDAIFNRTPRCAQSVVSDIAQQKNPSRLTIIETETGSGKTESALFLVDCLMRTANTRGAYIAMPSQATANQLFNRVVNYLKNHPAQYQQVETTLMHSNAELNAALEAIKESTFNFTDLKANAIATDEEKSDSHQTPSVVNSHWFSSRKRGCLSSFAVGTIDQLLMAGLLVKHNFVRLFGFAGRTIVLDEVHSLDAYQLEMLKNLLQWLARLQCPVVILSATLPFKMRQELFSAYLGENAHAGLEKLQQPYPRISYLDEEDIPQCFTLNDPQTIEQDEKSILLHQAPHQQHIQEMYQALITEINATNGEDVIVCIVNTVRDAQALYNKLNAYLNEVDYPGLQPLLFHARFLMGQKQHIEEQIETLLGPGLLVQGKATVNPQRPCQNNVKDSEPKHNKGMILIGTQVLEQSLNFDASCLFTVGAPVDLLLQRLGRLHRFKENYSARHSRYRVPKMHVWLASNIGPMDKRFGASGYVYPPYILQQSSDLLLHKAVENSVSFSAHRDMDNWIETVYGDLETIQKDSYQTEDDAHWQEKENQKFGHQQELRIKRSLANRFLFKPEPDLQDMLKDGQQALEDDELQVQTRLASPSITLVFLHCVNGQWCTAFDNSPVALQSSYDKQSISALKLSSVSIANPDWVQHFIQDDYQPLIWQQQPELKTLWQKASLLYGCVPVCLGGNNTYHKNSNDWLKLDPLLGVMWNDKQQGDNAW